MKLKNKVAIITGGTQGIGRGIAEEFLKEGAKVIIIGSNEARGKKRRRSAEEVFGGCQILQM